MTGATALIGTDLSPAPAFTLGGIEVFPDIGEVAAGARRERLQKRVMQVLVVLASPPDRVVSRDELIRACWKGRSVTDDAITRCVLQLRRLAREVGGFRIDTRVGIGYRLVPEEGRADLPALPDKPSIAVLPFANMSDDPEQDYLAEGMVEDVVGALARFKSIYVVAAGSSLTPDGRTLNPQESAARLGVRYLLDGSVRKAAGRVRVAVRLRDAASGVAVWTDRLEDSADDIFGLQDRVAVRVAGAMELTLQEFEVSKAIVRPTDSMGSYDLYLRSLSTFRAFTRDGMLLSIDLLDRAVALDPRFALALSHSAVCHRLMLEHGWAENPEACRARGLELVKQALRSESGDARVLAQCAASLSGFEDDLGGALALVARAIAINPSSAFAWLISGMLRSRAGEADTAADHLETAMRLDPISGVNRFHRMYLAIARFQQQRFDDTLALLRTTELRIPVVHAVVAAVHARSGRPEAARAALAEFLALDAGSPEDVAAFWFTRAEHRELFLDGIALAERA